MEKILVLDFGGEAAVSVAQTVRSAFVFSEIKPFKTPLPEIKDGKYSGIILAGYNSALNERNAPPCKKELFELGIPVLGIGYGAVIMARLLGGEVQVTDNEKLYTEFVADTNSPLFEGISPKANCLITNKEFITRLPVDFKIIAKSDSCPITAMENTVHRLYAVQFNTEADSTEFGKTVISNFVHKICKCKNTWNIDSFTLRATAAIKEKIGERRVVCVLDGSINSAVAALLVNSAVSDKLTCLFIDNGLYRANWAEKYISTLRDGLKLKIITVDARERFFGQLLGISDSAQKSVTVVRETRRILSAEFEKLGKADYLITADNYKSLLPAAILPNVKHYGKKLSPIGDLFCDEIKNVGIKLGLNKDFAQAHNLPITGLALKVDGCITPENIEIIRKADAVFLRELKTVNSESITEAYATLSAGNKTPKITLYAFKEFDFIKSWAPLPYAVLKNTSDKIKKEIGEAEIVYNIT